MRVPVLILTVLFVANCALDLFIYFYALRHCRRKYWAAVQGITAVALALWFIIGMALPARKGTSTELLGKMWVLFSYFTVYIPKYVALLIFGIAQLPRLAGCKQWHWLTKGGIVVAAIMFLAMWWGALVTRYQIDVKRVEISIANLPASFDGLTIVQLSDLHTGSYGTHTGYVEKLVDAVNELGADVIVFTGDIVNRQSDEAAIFVKPLSKLHAPLGRYAILGNHDYGDYRHWPTADAKQANMDTLYRYYDQMGFELLLNRTVWLRRGADSIAIIGVENIGEPPFPVYGSLKQAYPNVADANTKILLSHNPRHWTDSIANHPTQNVALTLAGHTHAMQTKIFGKSPSAWIYPTWGGLYTDSLGRDLYVNIGVGTVGYPARIGAIPEVTLLTLKKQ